MGDPVPLLDDTLERFRCSLETPNAARLYGFQADEVKLNHALHLLLSEASIGPVLLQGLARRVGGQPPDQWERISAGVFALRGARFQPRLSGNKRGDELVVLDGGPDLLIELKVEADGGDAQLADYVRRRSGEVLPLLLDLGGNPDDHGPDFPVLVAADYLAALDTVLKSELSSQWRAVIEDHRRSIEYLHLRDVVVRKLDLHAGLRSAQGSLRRWVDQEWRWVHKAAALEIKARLEWAGHNLVKRISINHDPNGSAVDLWLHTPEDLGKGVELFAKWRIGKGLEVHVGAWRVPRPQEPREVIAAVREKLRPALLEALRPLSLGEPTVSRRRGKSGLIVRAINESWSVNDGVEACGAGLAAIEPLLDAMGAVPRTRGWTGTTS